MPNMRSAAKRMRADRKRHARNLEVKSQLKSLTKKFLGLLKSGQAPETHETYRSLIRRLDQAASKGIIRRRTADRKKSRLSRQASKAADRPAARALDAPA